MSYPTEYRYSRDHEWVRVDGNRARIGITDHAQGELGDIVFVELPTVGAEVDRGATLGAVESVKAVGDILAPLSGKVVEVNESLESAPELVNSSPHEDGWILVLELNDASQVDALLDAAGYERLLSEG